MTELPHKKMYLVAGSTGYLGRYVVAELIRRGCPVRALARDASKAAGLPSEVLLQGDVLQPLTLAAACEGVDVVISCLGSSTAAEQAPGDAFRPVGEGNLNLFRAAAAAGAQRFIMTGSCNSRAHRREYEGFEAREAAVDDIMEACAAPGCCTSYTIIDPSMFFKDADRLFASMVRRGTASALGGGFSRRFNPIHGADLACRMVDSSKRDVERNGRIAVGGPDVLSLRNISVMAAAAAGVSRPRFRVAPLWLVRILVLLLAVLGRVWPRALRYRSFARFLLVVSQYDAIGERCGSRRMVDYMQELAERRQGGGSRANVQADGQDVLEGDSKKEQ